MRVEPDGAELLKVAREALLGELLPNVPESSRYAARMIANAMAIAARELEAGIRPEDELDRLRRLLPGWTSAPEVRAACRDGEAQLAKAIRGGRLDSQAAEVRRHLRATTRERLAVSNPRVLPGPR